MTRLVSVLPIIFALACAACAGSPAPSGAAPIGVTDLTGVVALAGLVLAGVATILAGVSVVLHAVAPRTKTTVDDRAAAAFDAARTDVLAVLSLLRQLVPAPAVVAPTPLPEPPPAPEPKAPSTAVPALAVALALAASSLAATQASCGAAPVAVAVGRALLDCTFGDRAALASAFGPALEALVRAASAGDGTRIDFATVRAALSPASLRTEPGVVLACAAARTFARLRALPPDKSDGAAPTSPTPGAVDELWLRLKADLALDASFKTPDGTL